jgi:triphosphatase
MSQLSTVPQEVEAKLLAPQPATLSAIARLRRIGSYRLRPRKLARLRTLYLDTATFILAHHGVALRLRRNRTRWEVSLKWSGKEEGAIHTRPELTVRLSRKPKFPFTLPPALQKTAVSRLIAEAQVEPILISDVDRRRFAVYRNGQPGTRAWAELSLDRVRLCGPTRGRPPVATYCEVEIELEQGGTVHDLRHFLGLLRKHFALTLAEGSKFSRGLTLLYGFDLPGNKRTGRKGKPAQRPEARAKKAIPPTIQQ